MSGSSGTSATALASEAWASAPRFSSTQTMPNRKCTATLVGLEIAGVGEVAQRALRIAGLERGAGQVDEQRGVGDAARRRLLEPGPGVAVATAGGRDGGQTPQRGRRRPAAPIEQLEEDLLGAVLGHAGQRRQHGDDVLASQPWMGGQRGDHARGAGRVAAAGQGGGPQRERRRSAPGVVREAIERLPRPLEAAVQRLEPRRLEQRLGMVRVDRQQPTVDRQGRLARRHVRGAALLEQSSRLT